MFHKLESTEKLNDLLHTHFPRLSILLQERLYFANRNSPTPRPCFQSRARVETRSVDFTCSERAWLVAWSWRGLLCIVLGVATAQKPQCAVRSICVFMPH